MSLSTSNSRTTNVVRLFFPLGGPLPEKFSAGRLDNGGEEAYPIISIENYYYLGGISDGL